MLAQVDNTDTSAQPRETPFGQLLNSAFSLQPLQLPSIKLQPSVTPYSAQPQVNPQAWLRAFSTPRI